MSVCVCVYVCVCVVWVSVCECVRVCVCAQVTLFPEPLRLLSTHHTP